MERPRSSQAGLAVFDRLSCFMTEFKAYPSINSNSQPMLLTIASGPVIIKGGKVLLDKHGDDPFWKFPGGRVRDGESFQQTAMREAKEELGLDIALQGEPIVLCFERQRNGVPETVLLIHYQATTSGEPRAQRDVREFAWHDIASLPDDCAPNVKPVVQACQSGP